MNKQDVIGAWNFSETVADSQIEPDSVSFAGADKFEGAWNFSETVADSQIEPDSVSFVGVDKFEGAWDIEFHTIKGVGYYNVEEVSV